MTNVNVPVSSNQLNNNNLRTIDPIVTLNDSHASGTSSITSLCFLHHVVDTSTRPIRTITNTTNNSNDFVITTNKDSDIYDGDDSDDNDDDDDDDDDDSDDESPIQFQCRTILQQQQRRRRPQGNTNPIELPTASATAITTSSRRMVQDVVDNIEDLYGRYLATCYTNGDCVIWDLGLRKIVEYIASTSSNRGPGITIRRLSDPNNNDLNDTRFFYQTRDDFGTITLHDCNATTSSSTGLTTTSSMNHMDHALSFIHNTRTIQTIQCYSQSFCSAAPCYGNSNLIVMPCQEHSYVMVRDWRIPSSHHPIAYFHGGIGQLDDNEDDDDDAFDDSGTQNNNNPKKYGMVTSLAMAEGVKGCNTSLIACGMENGSIVYHDLSMIRKDSLIQSNKIGQSYHPCSISLSTDPILSLDMVPSNVTSSDTHISNASFVTVAGMAGNEADLSDLPIYDRGRIAVLKTSQHDGIVQARLRTRISTLDSSYETNLPSGKPGIGQCRFRSDGRIFAIGGWDKRVRIYDRNSKSDYSSLKPLALLRGHDDSVNAIDWSYDAVNTGLLATGSSDGCVHVWRCFPSKY
jgi:hypothetical protein